MSSAASSPSCPSTSRSAMSVGPSAPARAKAMPSRMRRRSRRSSTPRWHPRRVDQATDFGIEFQPMLLSLDWMNLFGGLSSGQVTSVIVVAVIFTAAAGLTLLALIAFGVRSGIMAPAYSTRVPLASNTELGAFLGASAFGMISILLMTFLGFAENDLDNPLFLPLSIGPILIGGLLLLTGAGLAFRTVRRRSARPT